MHDLIFYDFDFNRLLDVRKFISVNFTINYCGYGDFEAHLPKTAGTVVSMLEQNPYLICIFGDNQAIITGWQLDDDIAIFGKTPEWLMTKRGLNLFSVTNSYPAAIANQAVSSAMGDFVNVTAAASGGSLTSYSTSRIHTVHNVVQQILKKDSMGFSLRGDIQNKRFVFRTYKGITRTVVVSPSNKSAHSMVYTKELQDFACGGWYLRKPENMGGWNASTNTPYISNSLSQNAYRYYKITASGSQFGLTCTKDSYLYSDTADGSWKISASVPSDVWVYESLSALSGAKKWECIMDGTKTLAEAQAELRERTITETVDTELRRLEYGTDFDLGDTLRVQFEFGEFKKTITKRVSGVRIFYDVDRMGICPVLE